MANSLDRAILLYQQSRFDLAEFELRRTLGEEPQNAGAHALLGMCLAKGEKYDAAMSEVEQAIVLSPGWAYPHYCRSLVLEARNRFAEAEASAREALRLAPDDADNYTRLGATLFNQRKWQEALDTCLQGLQFDGEHAGCANLRVMALTKLGRQQDALGAVDEALQRDPDNDVAHANKGWALLHQGKPKEALEHFREALRIDPTYEYAQAGIVEALKARHLIYRWILGYFLWMARLDRRVQWALILGGYFGQKSLMRMADENPALAPWVWPIIFVYLAFVLLTWFAVPFFNLLLRFNKFGRHALTRDQRLGANCFAVCVAIFVVGMTASLFIAEPWNMISFMIALAAAGSALPIVTIFQCDLGWPRKMMTLYASAMVLVGLAIIVLPLVGLPDQTRSLVPIFLWGFILTPWLANYLTMQTVKR